MNGQPSGWPFLFLRRGLGGRLLGPRDHGQGEHGLGYLRVLFLTAPVVVRVAPADVAPIIDQKQRPLGDASLFVEHAVAAGDGLVPIRQYGEGEVAQTLCVGFVGPDVIDAQAEYLGLRLHELLVIISQGGELIRSAGTEVEDVKGEQDVLAALEGREGNGIAVGCPRQGEIGRQVPNTGHVRRGRRHRPIVVR